MIAFSDLQGRQLKAKLDARHIKTRKAEDNTLHYIEGSHAIAEANRIFGFDAWDWRTLAIRCVWTSKNGQHFAAAYTAKVRIRVRAGDATITREGSGSGEGKGTTPGQAHELALESAETDATRRALATFGNAFKLALYDPEQIGVRHRPAKGEATVADKEPWVLRSGAGGIIGKFQDAPQFATALSGAMSDASTIEYLFAVWERNLPVVRAIARTLSRNGEGSSEFGEPLVAHLKTCARALASATARQASPTRRLTKAPVGSKIDKSALTFGELKRSRSKQHLRAVARQPCLICGRSPSHAHHVRFAQPKGIGKKVSDEFAVPLCAIHHAENHATGDERGWWEKHNVDPLAAAAQLWSESRTVAE
ncbi:MAG: Rad52/Rad22 family DNA repair protein [Methyloceanibacter sp.]